MKEEQMYIISDLIELCSKDDFESRKEEIIEAVDKLTKDFPLY